VITDVDCVLTDGRIYYDSSDECFKRFHVRDELSIRLLEENGLRVAVLSVPDSDSLHRRVTDLGVNLYKFGVKDKEGAACHELLVIANVDRSEIVCIGDDSIDLRAFEACGLSYAIPNAPEYIKRQAATVLLKNGGQGAFRELADEILKVKNKSDA
jgi:3-deoxy-D-manno-octulosonate 8-phosphate phosphatase (KDO 8-P phosphatase)